MPRYVILRHELPPGRDRPSHWDLMLEQQGTLRTWALSEPPRSAIGVLAEALPDHRIAYLDYEGPVSNDRGHVARWDAGEYQLLEETGDRLRFNFAGGKLNGPAELTRAPNSVTTWTFRLGAD